MGGRKGVVAASGGRSDGRSVLNPTGKPGRQGGASIVELLDIAGDDLLVLVSVPKLDRSAAASKWAKAVESRGDDV